MVAFLWMLPGPASRMFWEIWEDVSGRHTVEYQGDIHEWDLELLPWLLFLFPSEVLNKACCRSGCPSDFHPEAIQRLYIQTENPRKRPFLQCHEQRAQREPTQCSPPSAWCVPLPWNSNTVMRKTDKIWFWLWFCHFSSPVTLERLPKRKRQ